MSDHCWHGTNIVLTSDPPQYPQVCCYCGAKRNETYKITYEEGHGPHAPAVEIREMVHYYKDTLGEQPCPYEQG